MLIGLQTRKAKIINVLKHLIVSFTHIEVIIDVHVEDVLDDALQLPLLHPEPLRDEGDVAGHGDGRQLPGEIRGQLPVDEDGRFSTFRHVTEKIFLSNFIIFHPVLMF